MQKEMESNFVVSTEWLAANMNEKRLVILDASMKPVTSSEENHQATFVPNAIKFDIKKELSDLTSPYSSTLLPKEVFAEKIRNLGISDDSIIVVYDNIGLYSSPRAWYMLKSFGHNEVYVLNGGLPAWINEKRAVVDEYVQPDFKGNFSDRGESNYFCNSEDVLNHVNSDTARILDARSSGRFHSEEPEPRANLKSGHIPNSINLPFKKVLENGQFKSIEELEEIFAQLKMDRELFVFTCGSGITSCIISMAAEMAGYENVCIYDGSWTEWADENNSYPIERSKE